MCLHHFSKTLQLKLKLRLHEQGQFLQLQHWLAVLALLLATLVPLGPKSGDRDQKYVLLRLLRLENEIFLEPNFVFHEISHAVNSNCNKVLGPLLVVGPRLPPVNPMPLLVGELFQALVQQLLAVRAMHSHLRLQVPKSLT